MSPTQSSRAGRVTIPQRWARGKSILWDVLIIGLVDGRRPHELAGDDAGVAERDFLWGLFRRIAGYLFVAFALTTAGTVALFATAGELSRLRALLLAIAAGGAGSAVAALLSAADRTAQGWELDDGSQWPPPTKNEKKERFGARVAPLFVIRPFLGGFVGALAYSGFLSGALFDLDPSPEAVLFVALVSGFFAKTLLDVLKAALKGLVGR